MASPPAPVPKYHGELEGARAREFYKYYEPFDNLMRTSNEKVNSNPHGRMASFDDTLAVFTQFTCLRLNAQRCLVSCFDRNKQYILAEATKSLALATHKSDDPLDELWLGAGIQERNSMLCERTLELAENEKNHGRDPVVMFPDIEDDHWYKASRSHIRQPPDARCYAGVAIRSPFGPVIGVISVLYQDPRHGMSTKDHEFLQHMSSVVMSHLDMVRSKEEHRRTSQMVIALGSFFEGKDRLDDDLSSKDVMASRDLENQQLPPTAPGAAIAGSANTARSEACLSNPDTQDNNSAEDPSAFENLQAQMLSTDVKSTFSRAAHIIKDAVDLDGVVFLDASVGSYGGLVQSVPTHSDDDSTSYFARTSASSKECHVLGHAGHSVPQSSATEGFLHSLLTRYAQGRIFNIDPEEHDLHMTNSDNPEQTEDFGQQVDPAEAQNSSPQAREEVRRQRKADIQHLKRFFPQARSLAFIPLWDDHRGRWFSGCIAWSTQVIRLLHKDSELSFLRAFGIAIMSEVAKLDTAMADKAKSDLLNSISHELRSPLHGILGSIEVLESSSLDSLQHGLVQTVDTCGRTLLDTINHLLDFSKINNFTRKNSKRQKNSEIRQVDMLSLDSQIHVPTITEEALETVFAGHTSFAAHTKTDCEQQSIDSHATRKEEVRLIVDIEAKDYENWLFSTEGGAWKRLVMNLAGNSLKYTNTGYIYVKLTTQELSSNSEGRKRSRINLTVKDTGRGISKEYLQNNLFRPFAQEDPLNPGAGLGLSMVRHIVSNLGGEISVESEPNKGTEIRVEVIMLDSCSSPNGNEAAFALSEAERKLQGLKAVFVDPPISTDDETSAQRSLRTALDKQCRGWFKMEFSTVSGVQEVGDDAAVVMTTCQQLLEIREQLIKLHKPVLVLCESNLRIRQAHADNEALRQAVPTQFISQPFGPRRLAHALIACKEQQEQGAEDMIIHRETELVTQPTILHYEPLTRPSRIASPTTAPPPPSRVTRSQSKALEDSNKSNEICKTGPRLLLVDDNKINLQLLARYCKSKDHDYITASDGIEAVEAFSLHQVSATSRFDFICMDISMPRMDGLEATRRIRAFESANGLDACRVIALTGLASAEAQQEAFSSGVDVFMTKPVRLKELGGVLSEGR